MRKLRFCSTALISVSLLGAPFGASSFRAQSDTRVQVTLDSSEADQTLAIVGKQKAGDPISPADWQRLFSTEPYRRLQQREQGFHHDFTEESFRKFVLSPGLAGDSEKLHDTLDRWKQADLRAAAASVLTYLPDSAAIKAKVFPVIKPAHNSFVFEVDTDPAIFLYLDPSKSPALFHNTVAHEMHHIGLASTDHQYEERIAALDPRARKAAGWMGAFGEGLAVLAAAGGSDRDPVEYEKPEVQKDWAQGMRNLDDEFAALDDFFAQVLDGRLEGDAVDEKASTFFGEIRGPWYFVGYKMAVVIEQRDGRKALIECMLDYRSLLSRYNAAAAEHNQTPGSRMPLWSAKILDGVHAPTVR